MLQALVFHQNEEQRANARNVSSKLFMLANLSYQLH